MGLQKSKNVLFNLKLHKGNHVKQHYLGDFTYLLFLCVLYLIILLTFLLIYFLLFVLGLLFLIILKFLKLVYLCKFYLFLHTLEPLLLNLQ